MKIWANDLKVGDNIWYNWVIDFKNATVVEKLSTFKMPAFKLDNDDILFANQYVYTDRSDITDEMIDDMILYLQGRIKSHNETITEMYRLIDNINKNIDHLKQMKA